MCVDPSSILDNKRDGSSATLDDGAANTQLPDTGAPDRAYENPPVHFGTAFKRFLIWIYNLRVDNLEVDMCLSADYITATFWRLLYHPDIAIYGQLGFRNS